MDHKDHPKLNKPSTALGSIKDEALKSLAGNTKPTTPSMGYRTRMEARRNERARRLLGLVDV